MKEYHRAILTCADRYIAMELSHGILPKDPLYIFTQQLRTACFDGLSIPKLCRWLGYIQGCLIERGFTTVDTERDFSRPLFKHLDM